MLLWSESFDDTALDTAQSILCLGAAEIDRDNRHVHDVLQLLPLPIRYGGWGLGPATMRTPVAYVASALVTTNDYYELMKGLRWSFQNSSNE
jgi:hypothetical protein